MLLHDNPVPVPRKQVYRFYKKRKPPSKQLRQKIDCCGKEKKGKGCIAVPAYEGNLARKSTAVASVLQRLCK
eukprot:1160799-Pelagomonas_calceolata.AAC.4